MFKSNLISAMRFLRRNGKFAFLNILGLTTGLTCFLLILFFVRHELSFETFHNNRANLYRINFSFSDNAGNVTTMVNSPPAFVPGIEGKFPEMIHATRMRYAMHTLLANGEKRFYEDHGYYADQNFLQMFRFPMVSGDAQTALKEVNSIVITEEMAKRYFDNPNPVGSTLMWNTTTPLKVTGVLGAIPSNSHLNFDFLISFDSYVVPAGYSSDLTSWDWLGFMTYVELKNGADPAAFQAKLQQFFRDRTPEDPNPYRPLVQNISGIYLGSNGIADDLSSHIRSGSRLSVNALIIVAVLIVVVAGFNFSMLTNAIAMNRMKSIGIRKVLGAERRILTVQLLTESLLITAACLVLAYGVSTVLFPSIATLIRWDMVITASNVFDTLPLSAGVALLTGLCAGLYPAVLLSGYDIVKALKEEHRTGTRSIFQFKNLLVTMQFVISIGLIAATIVLGRQLSFLQNRSLGFEKENVVVMKLLPEVVSRHYQSYREELTRNSWVMGVSRSERVAGEPWPWSVIRRADEAEDQMKVIYFNATDYDYVETMGIKLKDGRTFSRSSGTDPLNSVIINQKAADMLGLANPVGQQVYFYTVNGPRTVIGVVDDFNYTSLHTEIGPAVMMLPLIDLEYLYVRVAPGDLASRMAVLEDTWKRVSGGEPMQWRLLDDSLNQLYQSEARLGFLIQWFAVLAIVLASLGLYGIVAFMINNRIKEFGIRKIMGASVASLYILFVRQYIYFIAAALLISVPIVNRFLDEWLQDFAYRTTIDWWTYPVAAVTLLVVALATITMQTLKAARVNPARLLRSE